MSPYSNINQKNLPLDPFNKSFGPRSLYDNATLNPSFDDLESQATKMKIINNGQINKIRKGSLPTHIKNNKNFTYGLRSDLDSNFNIAPGTFYIKRGESSMN